jgi:hypothetical protein
MLRSVRLPRLARGLIDTPDGRALYMMIDRPA